MQTTTNINLPPEGRRSRQSSYLEAVKFNNQRLGSCKELLASPACARADKSII